MNHLNSQNTGGVYIFEKESDNLQEDLNANFPTECKKRALKAQMKMSLIN